MEILNQVTTYVQYALAIVVALLALDNAIDAVAKTFGNKKIDTLCGIIALKLNAWIDKLKGLPTTGNTTTTTFTQTTGAN